MRGDKASSGRGELGRAGSCHGGQGSDPMENEEGIHAAGWPERGGGAQVRAPACGDGPAQGAEHGGRAGPPHRPARSGSSVLGFTQRN